MDKREILNACYKFLNIFITVNDLIKRLSELDTSSLSLEEKKKFSHLLKKIKETEKKYPNIEDEYVIKQREKLQSMINKLEELPPDAEIVRDHLGNLKKEQNKEIDSHERWQSVANYIIEDELFNEIFDGLSNNELLEFIIQNIKAPNPPHLGQEKFDELVHIGIEKDKREWLWRLAFNYENKGLHFDDIANYYIDKKDGYYLSELICAVGWNLDMDKIIKKIKDKELIEDLQKRKSIIKGCISDEDYEKLMNKLK